MTDLGPELPRNWYLLGRSADLGRGEIASHDFGPRTIIVYRGLETGRAVAFDGHCVHMGCHLGRGKVIGDRLRCGLHHRLIDADGTFAERAGSELQQGTHPVCEYMGGLFVHLGGEPGDRSLADLALDGHAFCYAGEHRFPLSWQALLANGFDIEHLASVHDRALQGVPVIEQRSDREFRLQYVTQPTGNRWSDRIMNWLAPDGVYGSIRCLSGSMMLVESRLGRRETFILMSFCPDGSGGTIIRGLVGVKRPPTLKNRISARIARALFKAFLYKDLHVLEGLKWHEPTGDHTLGDRSTRQLCAFFRSLPSA